jgi:hypothetical protein
MFRSILRNEQERVTKISEQQCHTKKQEYFLGATIILRTQTPPGSFVRFAYPNNSQSEEQENVESSSR